MQLCCDPQQCFIFIFTFLFVYFTVSLPGWGCAGWSPGHRRTLNGAPWCRAAADSWRNPRPCRWRSNHANWAVVFLPLWRAAWLKALTQPWLNAPCLIYSANTIKSPPWSWQNIRRGINASVAHGPGANLLWVTRWTFRKRCRYELWIFELQEDEKVEVHCKTISVLIR